MSKDTEPGVEASHRPTPQKSRSSTFSRIFEKHPTLARGGSTPFIGRLGGNQEFVLNRDDADSAVIRSQPDAAPGMSLKEQFDLKPFTTPGLWKAAVIEGVGTFLLVYLTVWGNLSPNVLPTLPGAEFGYFANAAYIGPLTGGFANFGFLTLFTFAFGVVTGAHLNPAITMATFFVRLCSLPRAVLYISFQTFGATLAGFMVRASYGTRNFKCGGCWLFSDVVPVKDAFAIEFTSTLALFFVAFGVGLDPRQRAVIPPALSPFLVGMALGVISWFTGYTRYGFGGASMNPARCFGTFVGSYFPGWHWYHWIAPLCAAICHACFYFLAPPGVSAS